MRAKLSMPLSELFEMAELFRLGAGDKTKTLMG